MKIKRFSLIILLVILIVLTSLVYVIPIERPQSSNNNKVKPSPECDYVECDSIEELQVIGN